MNNMRSDLLDYNIELNHQTSGLKDSFESHRTKVMQLIEASVQDLSDQNQQKCSSIVLLGPGNCLDIDLPRVCELFQTVHLVDIDEQAVQTAVKASGVSAAQVKIHAPADVAEPLLSLTSRDLSGESEDTEQLVEILQLLSSENGIADVPEADVVVSLCLMSQILGALHRIIHPEHPAFQNAVKALRVGHLRRILSMLREGGVGVLVSDVVSSESAPELTSAAEADLEQLVKKLVHEGNFFSGTNPSAVINDLNLLSRLPTGPESVHTFDPWLWHIGERAYAVYALRIQRKLPVTEEEMEIPDALDD